MSRQNQNGLPADACTNTWHFESSAVDPIADASVAVGYLETFYSTIDFALSSVLVNACDYKVYDLTHSVPRSPIYAVTASISAATGTPLPNELAIVMSYHAAGVSGLPAGRRRGRIYLGPLDGVVLDESSYDGTIQDATIATITGAGAALIASSLTGTSKWCTFSPTLAGTPPWSSGDLIASSFLVENGFVDNAFDIQRRRGTLATSRVNLID
jgi:hypothetical protein